MENYFEGTISRLSSYYGVITFDEERQNGEESYTVKRSVPFFSNDLSQYSIGNTVSFSLPQISTSDESNTLLVRGQAVQFATNVQVTNDDTEEVIDKPLDFYQLLNSKLIPSPNLTNISSALDFLKRHNLRYSTFNEILVLSNLIDNQVTIADFQSMIDYDKKFKEFIMKWVLFVEDDIKARIENRMAELDISERDLFSKADSSSDNNLKRLFKDSLKSVRKNYLLRDCGDLRLQYEATTDEIPMLENAPIDMVMDQFTVGDLLIFIKFINDEYNDFKDDTNTDWEKVSDFLSELKLVRNISAHGNSFLSAILDEKNNPNYLLEENSHIYGRDPFYIDASKETSIFHLVRSPIKLMLKGQVSNPQHVAVFWTQKLLNNQTLRSFVYFYFMVCYLTQVTSLKEEFKNELREVFGEFDKKVNFEKVVIDVLSHPSLNEKNRKNLLDSLIPQAINMFDYVKEHNYEYTGCGGDTIYEITYFNKKVRINLSDNANWHLYMLKDITDKHPNDDTAETSTWPESQEIREKFGIFFREDSNARETLIRMLDSNRELECNEGIKQLSKIEEFQKLKSLFLDILNLFN
ncbi:Abi family protein [Streptococcus parasanguinis]|jgi:hypothetical protein|uniref:Abi family protein n=1 Tax=Streptococcus parasanguinis TaxID=1318 RepID=UPI00189A45AC|nr:Abi family protein [Streptococcus parasanguinis]